MYIYNISYILNMRSYVYICTHSHTHTHTYLFFKFIRNRQNRCNILYDIYTSANTHKNCAKLLYIYIYISIDRYLLA